MTLAHQIRLNQFAQDIETKDNMLTEFLQLSEDVKRKYMVYLVEFIHQSKPQQEDVEHAIAESGLKSTFTPCVLLKKGIGKETYNKLLNLPSNEETKTFILLIYLFKKAYLRRYFQEKEERTDKWWYWDLSEKQNIDTILEMHGINKNTYIFNINNPFHYKILFAPGFNEIQDVLSSYTELHVIFGSGDIYSLTLITVGNIDISFMGGDLYVWKKNMIIVQDLYKETIRTVIKDLIADDYFLYKVDKIGTITDIYGDLSFKQLISI